MPPIAQRKTPGVYITEYNAFPPSVVGVETAVPAFIGYTEFAEISGKPVYLTPVRIESLADYEAFFGAGFKPIYNIRDLGAVSNITTPTPDFYDFEFNGDYYKLVQKSNSTFYMYDCLRMFYANGGGSAYIVSVGNYTDSGSSPDGVQVTYKALNSGLTAIKDQSGPTMLVIPDAVLLPSSTPPGLEMSEDALFDPEDDIPVSDDFAKLTKDMLNQCGATQDRVAILDVYGAQRLDQTKETFSLDLAAVLDRFYMDVGDNFLNYGMAYFPFLNTSIIEVSEITYTRFNIGDSKQLKMLQDLLDEDAREQGFPEGSTPTGIYKYIQDMDPTITDPNNLVAVNKLNQNLYASLPLLKTMETLISKKMNVLPPSGSMSGVFAFTDRTKGVWNAPANITLNAVVSPTVKLNNEQQGNLNVPVNGKAVDVVRFFVGRGPVVWGARTLDGNSNDWRYIQVRRALIYIEQSIKGTLNQFVFAPNDGNTWVTVVSTISNFLTSVWAQGGLMGSKADEAFTVLCGVGSTMTGMDVLEGYMVVQVTLQMIRPAEFIELTFKQKMEGVG